MGYTLNAAQKAPLLDENGNPIPSGSVTSPGGTPPPFAVGQVAQVQDDGAGFLECVANSPGTITFDLKSSGTVVSHDVTVTAAPFDWTLGTPVAK